FIYSTEKEKVEIGVIAKNEVRIIGYAGMEELHDKYCGILEELEEEAEEDAEPEEAEEALAEDAAPREKTEYTWKDDNLTVTAVLTDPEAVPDDAELVVTPITKETEGYNYRAYMDALTGEITAAGEKNTVLYDVAFLADEKDENGEKTGRTVELQPENDKVKVTFRFNSPKLTEEIGAKDAEKIRVVHLPLAEAAKESADTTRDAVDIASADISPESLEAHAAVGSKSGRVEFETEGFSVFALVYILDSQWGPGGKTHEGGTYRVTVTYDENALIPEGAELEVSEITEGEDYNSFQRDAQTLLDARTLEFLRVFDIRIVCDGKKVEPAADVRVKIEYIDRNQPEEAKGISVVHFADRGPEILTAAADIDDDGIMGVSFSTESFSPFATVSERLGSSSITNSVIAFFNFDELDENGGFTSTVNGITAYAVPIASGAVPDLSPAYDGNVLKLENSNADALTVAKSDGSSLLTGLTEATISYWAYASDDRTGWAYYAAPNAGNQPMEGGEQYIGAFQNSGTLHEERYYQGRGGGNYSIETQAGTGAWHYVTVVYGTSKTTVYVDGVEKGTKSGQPALNDILGSDSIFQIGKANWGSGEYFTGYLDEMMILNRALTAAEAASLYNSGYAQNIAPEKQDKINIRDLVNFALANGIDTVTADAAEVPAGSYRTNLPGKVLEDVIFFATEYNHGEYNYDYYAVTHDGGLAKVTDLGSEIMWKDPRDIKWDLIVYTNTISQEEGPALVVPSGYYELAYTDTDGTVHYLAPQLNTGSLIQGGPLGLQFAGASAGTHGTTIEAWDTDDIEYAGLQIQHEGLTAVTGGASEEFFFARNTVPVSYTEPRPVATVDSASKGIQISLFDYNGGRNGQRPEWMETLIGDGVYRSGHQITLDLVKHNLNNGVPVASLTNNTLTELFGGNSGHVEAIHNNVNHLFLQGTYDETGYFSYNSAQNYAYYNGGSFTVYDQAAAPDGTGSANYHGNFFPYNTFGEASASQYMWYDVNDTLLTPDDPEYGTALHSLSGINYTFGMEVATDFYMTKTGLDERGRDIVYEFNGDDDLWVFVDDKLALDIGGVHGAIHGTINFTTGEIVIASENLYSVTGETSTKNATVAGSIQTTLAEQFRLAYKEQGKTDAEITALLDSTFNKDSGGHYTSFKPYTTHNMKMFYMESGMGASNLNIRFNLPVVPPASFAIEKELPETVQAAYTDRRFAFRVYVQNEYNSAAYTQITQDQVGEGKLVRKAVYEKTSAPAAFEDGILYLRPGEAVQLTISDERLKYYVEEIQIDPVMWDRVEINHAPAQITMDNTGSGLGYVSSDAQAVNQRTRLVYDNVPKNVQKLLINKIVESAVPESIDPNLVYEFYVYLEGQSGNLEPYSVGEYYLTKTTNGVKHYYNNAYNDLGTEPQICSRSGQYGSIGNIRAGYTIEIPGLIPGTDFYVVEREDRNPEGYTFIRKELTDGTWDQADEGISLTQNGITTAPDGRIKAGANAEVTIVNGNHFTVALPATGGPGTALLTLFGLMLAGTGAAGLMMRRRRQETA
ncbi:MAG: fibro-slime domain-containing protein, partial [Lachnospiraceae bacterium]|nr:fibro-slime domain-containing protein [Lachnospiraceae bacterium]